VTVVPNITYATVGGQPLVIYLYLPKNAKYPTPIVAYTHGGGFVGGNVDGATDLANAVAARGYAFASIDYQTSDVATMPAPIHDEFGGIRYLRTHAAEYNLDPARVITMGSSAGSELATLVGVVANDPSYWGTVGGNSGQSDSVQGIVGISGVWYSKDLDELDKKHVNFHVLELGCTDLTEANCGPQIHAYFPEFHLDAGDPSMLMLQGGKNSAAPPSNAQHLIADMKAAGMDATLFIDPDLGDTQKNATNHLDILYAFLDRVFAK
jgi:acetyl esterase/lipase